MKRLLILVAASILVCVSFGAAAVTPQPTSPTQDAKYMQQRMVFLWDVTISMVGATSDANCPVAKKRTATPSFAYPSPFTHYYAAGDIFDSTREDLIQLISRITNESTEIIVLPFRNGIVDEFKANATPDGKRYLIDKINAWNDLRPGATWTGTCLKEAVDKYFTSDKINTIILLTDGCPTPNDQSVALKSFLRDWAKVENQKGPYSSLIYVMLTKEANDQEIIGIIEETPNEDVILPGGSITEYVRISVNNNATIYVRDYLDGKVSDNGQGSIELPYSVVQGNQFMISSATAFHFVVEDNPYIEIDPKASIRLSNGTMTIPFRLKGDLNFCLQNLPSEYDTTVNMACIKEENDASKNLSIFGDNNVVVSLVMKTVPRVTIKWKKD